MLCNIRGDNVLSAKRDFFPELSNGLCCIHDDGIGLSAELVGLKQQHCFPLRKCKEI